MKNSATTQVVLFLLVGLVFPAPVLAAVTVENVINEDIYVTLTFNGFDPVAYGKIKANTEFNATTIPQIIVSNLAQKNLRRVAWGYTRINYDDTESSVHVAFHLGGSDIINFSVNRTTMVRTYQVSTDWRKFKVNLTDEFSVDFVQHFNVPLSQWPKTNRTDASGVHPVYYYESTGEELFHTWFYFILPATATNVQASEDTITYEAPPYAEDLFLNSPFLILSAVLAISIITVVYRKTRA